RNLLSISVGLRGGPFRANTAKQQFLDEWQRAAMNIPGVMSATVTESIPPHLGFSSGPIETEEGRSVAESATISRASIDTAFFRTLGIPVLRGVLPNVKTEGRREAVISHSFASVAWPNADPVGRLFRIARADPWYVVVGVAGDVQNGSFEQPLGAFAVYELRSAKENVWWVQSLVLRTNGDLPRIELAARDVVKRLDARVPITSVDAASTLFASMNSRIRFTTWLMVSFSGVAAFL